MVFWDPALLPSSYDHTFVTIKWVTKHLCHCSNAWKHIWEWMLAIQAVRRRFDKRIYIPLPELKARQHMFKVQCPSTIFSKSSKSVWYVIFKVHLDLFGLEECSTWRSAVCFSISSLLLNVAVLFLVSGEIWFHHLKHIVDFDFEREKFTIWQFGGRRFPAWML